MTRMTSCASTKGKAIIRPLLHWAHTEVGSQLQSLGVGVPAPIVYFVLLVKLTAPVSVWHPQEKGPWQGGNPTGCKLS